MSAATGTCHPADRALDPAYFDAARIERLFRSEPSAEDLLNSGDSSSSSSSSSSASASAATTGSAAAGALTAWGILPSSRKVYKMRPPPRPKARGRRRMNWQERAAMFRSMYGHDRDSNDDMDSGDEEDRPECAIM